MLSGKQKQRLEDLFFQDRIPPDQLDQEEMEYWSELSQQWDQALSHIYRRILHHDTLCDSDGHSKD